MSRHVYFDLDGTLTDPFEGISKCIDYALQRLGVPVPGDEALRSCIGPPLLSSFEQIVGVERAPLGLAHYRERFGDRGWRENRVYDGIEAMLDKLTENGDTLFVATSKPRVYADRIIEHFGLAGFFHEVFGSELDGTRVEKTDLLAYALHQSDGKTAAVMIGDREHDIIGALNNEMRAIGVSWGYGSPGELERAGASCIAARPEDLPALLT